MKYVLAFIAMLSLTQTVQAESGKYRLENMSLVEEHLNKDIYTFSNVFVNFSISKNRDVAHLQIFSRICPEVVGGISCLAMPIVILNAVYTLTFVEADACGVKTFVSNTVEVGSRFMRNQRRFAQIRVQDFSSSVCEMIYPSDVNVDLKDTTLDSDLGKVAVHYSKMSFNYVKQSGPVTQ